MTRLSGRMTTSLLSSGSGACLDSHIRFVYEGPQHAQTAHLVSHDTLFFFFSLNLKITLIFFLYSKKLSIH